MYERVKIGARQLGFGPPRLIKFYKGYLIVE